MNKCEAIQIALDQAIEEGHGALIEALETAKALAGCGDPPLTADSGGGGHGDPD